MDQPRREGSNAVQDRHHQGVVLVHVVIEYPTSFRLSDLIRELAGDPAEFPERDRIERAVRDLIAVAFVPLRRACAADASGSTGL
jgi:hypothetical protein